jgi:hypothetical protein
VLEAALAYARMGLKVFPLHGFVNGRCTCGSPHADGKSIAKHPRTKRGFKDATDDPVQIRKWFSKWPDSNIGIATGSGLVVIDIDGAAGAAEFKELVTAHGPPPATLISQTGNGVHALYLTRPDSPEVRSSARGHVHVRGEGGYIVAPPSMHASGRTYQWVRKNRIAELPEWLRKWSQGYEISPNITAGGIFKSLGDMPAWLQAGTAQNQRDITETAREALKTVYSPSEHARIASALQAIPVKTCSYDDFLRIGMALKELDWQKPDGTDIGYELWDAWCSLSEHHNPEGLEFKWRSFKRSGVSVGSLYHMAREAGWTGGAPAPAAAPLNGHHPTGMNGHAGPAALPAAFLAATANNAIFFPDMTEEGKIRATMLNAKVAIGALGVACKYDQFHNRLLVAGELVSKWNSPQLSDPIVTVLRDHIRYRFGFDPGKQQVQDACETLCMNCMFNPVTDYLDSLQWDGKPRLDSWLSAYLGVVSNEYVQAVGRLSLLAAVRRVRHPGTKFDQIIVLEGKQGAGKSEAIRILAGPDNFSDQKILDVDERKQQELTEGVWLYEIAELTGLKRADIDHVKAFVSRTSDRARPAYGRYVVNQPRQTVFFGSINPGQAYLQDDTGNRRFWPVTVGRIDLAGLARDRDQLWAEANQLEAQGMSHMLPERLWKVAAEEQDKRTEGDEWSVPIGNYITLKGLTDLTVMQALTDNQFLRLEAKEIGHYQQTRAARVLRGLGFERYRDNPDKHGHRAWRYRRAQL